jgi:tetratricopeptide (TPR) repeat protein
MLCVWAVCSLLLVSDPPLPAGLSADDVKAYEDARAKVGRDADAQVRLALWCEAHGMKAERLKHLAIAVLRDPAHPVARGLLGFVHDGGAWRKPEEVARKAAADAQLSAAREEYQRRRIGLPNQADAHFQLALWCEQNGLKAESKAHLHRTIEIDPKREDAWKRLGYKRYGNRWMTDAQIASAKSEHEARVAADHKWKPILEQAKSGLTGKQRKVEAERILAGITDPRAVPMIVHVFGAGKSADQMRAVQILGQINDPAASRSLATLAVYGKSDDVRRIATETLRQRDPREFADLLIGLLRDPIKYEVKPVAGPGSPGELWVEGDRYDRKRHYLVPPPLSPALALFPGDRLGYDQEGLPVIVRNAGVSYSVPYQRTPGIAAFGSPVSALPPTAPAPATHGNTTHGTHGPRGAAGTAPAGPARLGQITPTPFIAAMDPLSQAQDVILNQLVIPVGRIERETQIAVASAQSQLERDVAVIENNNSPIRRLNDRVLPILEAVTGNRFGENRREWDSWFADLLGMSATQAQMTGRETIEDAVTPQMPQTGPVLAQSVVGQRLVPHHSCFARGTLVNTMTGPRAIESVALGDLVLSQHDETGALSFQPVLRTYQNPPNQTRRVELENDAIICTGIHRLWVAGRGWVMARELKPNDQLRTTAGLTKVVSVRADAEQPVFNLRIAEAHSFFVGRAAVLAHDNSDYKSALTPFDALARESEPADAPGDVRQTPEPAARK